MRVLLGIAFCVGLIFAARWVDIRAARVATPVISYVTAFYVSGSTSIRTRSSRGIYRRSRSSRSRRRRGSTSRSRRSGYRSSRSGYRSSSRSSRRSSRGHYSSGGK